MRALQATIVVNDVLLAVGIIGPIAAAEMSRLHVTPQVHLPSIIARTNWLPEVAAAEHDLAAASPALEAELGPWATAHGLDLAALLPPGTVAAAPAAPPGI